MTTEISNHFLVPAHEVLDEKSATGVLMTYKVDRSKLPKIMKTDPALPESVKIGDIVKITRKSPTAGEAIYYRVVVE